MNKSKPNHFLTEGNEGNGVLTAKRRKRREVAVSFCDSCASLRPLPLVALFVCSLVCTSAQAAANFEKITANMGNIDLDGLPRLTFDIVDAQDASELAALGFDFTLAHQTKLSQGRTARTEWSLPCPQTSAHIDTWGSVIWQTAGGDTVRFVKGARGYAGSDNNSSVKVSPDGNVIEFMTQAALKWRYRNGFLENISSRSAFYSVTTDCGTILSISKKILNREITLLKCLYSKQGRLEEMEFPGGRKYRFEWSADGSLASIDGPEGRRFNFEYTDALLSCWTKTGGPRNELKWQYYIGNVRTTAFQTPPVLLREDASYVYKWDKADSVDTVKVYNKAGALLSETKIGAVGIVQTTPNGMVRHAFGGE